MPKSGIIVIPSTCMQSNSRDTLHLLFPEFSKDKYLQWLLMSQVLRW